MLPPSLMLFALWNCSYQYYRLQVHKRKNMWWYDMAQPVHLDFVLWVTRAWWFFYCRFTFTHITYWYQFHSILVRRRGASDRCCSSLRLRPTDQKCRSTSSLICIKNHENWGKNGSAPKNYDNIGQNIICTKNMIIGSKIDLHQQTMIIQSKLDLHQKKHDNWGKMDLHQKHMIIESKLDLHQKTMIIGPQMDSSESFI